MNADLALLIELQKTMEHYDRLKTRAEELPSRIEASKLEHQAIMERHQEVIQKGKQAQVDLHEAEVDLKAGEELLVKKQAKLHEVKTNVEYTAALHEIEMLNQKNSETETRILELMDGVERAKEAISESEKSVEQDKAQFAQKLQTLENELKAVVSEAAEYKALVETKRSQLRPQLVATFDRIYARNDGMALAPSNNKSCGHCQVSLPPHQLQAAREGREIVICDHCGSILYWEEEPQEVAANKES